MRRCAKMIWLPALAALLAACASGPKFDDRGASKDLTPQQAAAAIDAARGKRVIWGGVVLATNNLKDSTQIEVLGYPLDRSYRPDDTAAPTARFLVVKPGYVETADYVAGRLISISGEVEGTRVGQIGEVSYTYPIVRPDNIYLWPRQGREPDSRVHFGLGIGIIR